MCGIVGVIGKPEPELAPKMNQAQFHRGPDDAGVYADPEKPVTLAMRRLSILDIAGGHQPMSNEDGSIWVVFNGEIFNFSSLKKELTAGGHRFKSDHSDTETLLHLYEEKGSQMLASLNGMFAFVIYDRRRNLLFGARDRMGIKPLYYFHKGGIFSFASELKLLLLLKDAAKKIDIQSLYHYMSFQFIPAPRTIFQDIKKLAPAHYFTFDINANNFKTYKYWDLPCSSSGKIRREDAPRLIRQELNRAVSQWAISDVPVACSLSGGIDSSAVVGLLSGQGAGRLKTYSLGFRHKDESVFDERNLARQTSRRWGTQHCEIILAPDDLLEDLEKMVWHLDEPYGGGLPSWYVFKAMKGDVKVALTGTGGDELFGNYGKWKVYESLFARARGISKWALFDRSPLATAGFMRKYPQGYFYHRYLTENIKRKSLFREEVIGGVEPSEFFIQKLWQEAGDRSPRDIVAYIDFKLQLPEEFLHMTDRFSMAHSIEARVPFLDHKLVELVMGIAPGIRTSAKNLKYLFINAVKDVLAPELINSPKKGFILPIDRWLRGPLRGKLEYYLGQDYIKKQGLFSEKFYPAMVKPYLKGRRYLSNCIWTVFMFQMWYHRYVERT